MGVFESYGPAAYQAKGKAKIAFVATQVVERFANRLKSHERLKRPGGRIENTGAKCRIWDVYIDAINNALEPDIPQAFYPDVLNRLCDALEIDGTGTLTLPTRGPKRVQVESVTRTEKSDERDFASLVVSFWEDNEDGATAAQWSAPSSASVVYRMVQKATKSLHEAGIDSLDIADINAFAAELEGLANAPGNFVDKWEAKANAVVNACARVERAFGNASVRAQGEVSSLLLEPEASVAGRNLRKIADVARRSTEQKFNIARRTVVRRYNYETSILEIAAKLGQNATELMVINASLPDVLAIPALTPVLVFKEG